MDVNEIGKEGVYFPLQGKAGNPQLSFETSVVEDWEQEADLLSLVEKGSGSEGKANEELSLLEFLASQGVRIERTQVETPESPRRDVIESEIPRTEGTTLSKVGNMIARGLAGLAGGALYGTAFVVGGALSLAILVPSIIIATPFVLTGAIIGKLASKEPEIGAGIGLAVSSPLLAPFVLTEAILEVPKYALTMTIGRLGTSLLAFAKSETEEEKAEFTVKLWVPLFMANLPVLTAGSVLFSGEESETPDQTSGG